MYVLLFPFLAHGASGNSARNSDKNSNTSVALVSPMHYATPKGKVQMVPDFHMGKHDMGKSHQFSKISKWKYYVIRHGYKVLELLAVHCAVCEKKHCIF